MQWALHYRINQHKMLLCQMQQAYTPPGALQETSPITKVCTAVGIQFMTLYTHV